jgi:hypothetical protein
MAEFEEKLNAILSDPKAMGQIMSIAKALGASGEADGQNNAAAAEPADPSREESPPTDLGQLLSPLGDIDPKLVQTALRLFSEYSATDDRKTALLSALQPFLKEERYAKVDKAVQITKLSRVARVAFHLLKGGEEDL